MAQTDVFVFAEVRDEWPIGLHHLQLWFGVKDFVVCALLFYSLHLPCIASLRSFSKCVGCRTR